MTGDGRSTVLVAKDVEGLRLLTRSRGQLKVLRGTVKEGYLEYDYPPKYEVHRIMEETIISSTVDTFSMAIQMATQPDVELFLHSSAALKG